MKKIAILAVLSFSILSCSKDFRDAAVSNSEAEMPQRQQRQGQNMWPTNDQRYFNALNERDLAMTLQYYDNAANFDQYTDRKQKTFLMSTLIGRVTSDHSFLAADLNRSGRILQSIIDRNLPCQSCIVQIIKAAESTGNIASSTIPAIIDANEPQLRQFHSQLLNARDSCDCPGAEQIANDNEVRDYEQVVFPYFNR